MTITSQNNVNECGICVINSLHNYFYHDNIKNQLLNDANFNTNGISILEFERLCSKHSIITETYEINIDELKNMQIKNYFVLILNTNNFLHYVIAKKIKNNKIIILDSLNGEYEITYDKLKEIFSNIIIFAKKSLIKNKPFLNRT
jgi:ABC-type bacteriocin/lantibiotic exporter with double-glycine peptidase domain